MTDCGDSDEVMYDQRRDRSRDRRRRVGVWLIRPVEPQEKRCQGIGRLSLRRRANDNPGERRHRRTRRGRDDPGHLGRHQGEAAAALPGHEARLLRPVRQPPRRDRRPGDDRRRPGHRQARRRREVRDHHPR